MRISHVIFLALLLAIGTRANAQSNAPLKLLHTTPLPGFKGDLDHSAVDLNGHRLFVTAEVHKTVEVFDLNTGERIHSITGFETPHEILFRPKSNTLIVADGGNPGSELGLPCARNASTRHLYCAGYNSAGSMVR
jgi:DNA-binding beta-propeller fold protein YncE